ncbi:tyrosine-type recombinase/integrase [Bacillus sp. Bos-x628]|uniref:tyrosine-type recombinase/integrase n=1 Tax=Bacillus maqinnsis TaxID=3229854 RepID=UPI00338FE702
MHRKRSSFTKILPVQCSKKDIEAEIANIPIHGLRHTHAVLLLEAGQSIKFIQERLGHKNISITSDVYAHNISEKIRK